MRDHRAADTSLLMLQQALTRDSQRHDVGVGRFHGDGQRVLASFVHGVLIGSSL